MEMYASKAVALDVSIAKKHLQLKDRQSIGQMICEFAESNKFDLIFMSRRKLSRLQELVLGSVSHYVVNHASCAVLLVHPSQQENQSKAN
jgi:nucleotide-binding universal stress UspA family protein